LVNYENKVINFESASKVISKPWLIGFTEAEQNSKFSVYFNKKNKLAQTEFIINTNKHDYLVLLAIKRILHIPNKLNKINNYSLQIKTQNARSLSNIVNYYKSCFKGFKSLEFKLWSKIIYYKNKLKLEKVERLYKIILNLQNKKSSSCLYNIPKPHQQPKQKTASLYNLNINKNSNRAFSTSGKILTKNTNKNFR